MLKLKRRKPPRSGIERAPQREWPKHRKWVRGFGCIIATCPHKLARIEFAHVRNGTDGGTGLKPSDWWGVALCVEHHRVQHKLGEQRFEDYYGVDLKVNARWFAEHTVDLKMREAMKSARKEGCDG